MLSKTAERILREKYYVGDETYEQLCLRVAYTIAGAEATEDERNYWSARYYQLMQELWFLPAGRILANTGSKTKNLYNCYTLSIEDSRESIYETLSKTAEIFAHGGGVGFNFSKLRERGAPVSNGSAASGPISFMHVFDKSAEVISQASRRGAMLALLEVDHLDIEEFIKAKDEEGILTHFNLSVGLTDEFMQAVEDDEDFYLKSRYMDCKAGEFPADARTLFDSIAQHAWKSGDPGFIYIDRLEEDNATPHTGKLETTNPCLVGDTIIAVADGRNHVTIKQLADEDKDVPVFSLNRETGKVEVKVMRHPRLTGRDKKILKISLDGGSFVRCTENHKIVMKDGSIKLAKDITSGDRLHHLIKFHASFEEIFKKSNSRSQDYIWLNNGNFSRNRAEHRYISEFSLGRELQTGEVVHHKDYNAGNNSPENLEVMTKKAHDAIHREGMLGANNPMNRFPEKNYFLTHDFSGSENGRYKGYAPEEIFLLLQEYIKVAGRQLSRREWKKICSDNDYPDSKYIFGKYKTWGKMSKAATEAVGLEYLSPFVLREYKKYLQVREETDLDIFFEHGSIYVFKYCEVCGEPFVVKWNRREQSICSPFCVNTLNVSNSFRTANMKKTYEKKQKETRELQINAFITLKDSLGRQPLKKEWETSCSNLGMPHRIRVRGETTANKYCFRSYEEVQTAANLNFTVASVEEDGYEDVYTGTVDDNHNFYILVSETTTKSGKPKFNYINNLQCGETPLRDEACCLASINLTKMLSKVDDEYIIDQEKLVYTVSVVVRFLDSVHDISQAPIPEIDDKIMGARRVGLGIFGWADVLVIMGVPYESEAALYLAERVSAIMKQAAYDTSVLLAKEKGAYPVFDPEKSRNIWYKGDPVLPTRNAMLLSLAPTGSISLLANTNGGVEPFFALAYKKNVTAGSGETKYQITNINQYLLAYLDRLVDADTKGKVLKHLEVAGEIQSLDYLPIKLRELFKTSHDISPEFRVKMQATWQTNVDGAISSTINLPHTATVEDIKDIIMLGWKLKLKGLTVFRDKCRQLQVLEVGTQPPCNCETCGI